jgi:hypothetical protein
MFEMLRKFLRIINPNVKRRLRFYFREESKKDREKREGQIRKVPLTQKHVQNCELLLNRSVMLGKFKNGGVVAEIGVDKGDFSEQILKLTEPSRLHLIDVWDSGRYHTGLFEKVTNQFKELIEEERVQIHRKLSTDAVEDFQDGYFDWIYIDTDHSYELTREELLRYAPKVKADGIIAGHDYSMGNWIGAYRYGVIEAVHEFCVEHDWELVYLTAEPIEMPSFAITRIQ